MAKFWQSYWYHFRRSDCVCWRSTALRLWSEWPINTTVSSRDAVQWKHCFIPSKQWKVWDKCLLSYWHFCVGKLTSNSQPVKNKKLEKTHAKEKQLHAQDHIYVVWQFAHVYRVAGISLLSGKSSTCGSSVFFSLKNYNNKTLTAQSLHSID